MAANSLVDQSSAYGQYCEAIFELREDDVEVIQARIAERMGVSRPAVSEMVRRLEADQLITVDGAIELTDRGEQLAQSVVRRHRLAERMLTDILGMSWAEAHEEASNWERVISPAVEKALVRVLNSPTTCPHGNPIPGAGYRQLETVALGDLAPNEQFEVDRVPEELEFTPGLLEYLEASHLTPGRLGTVTAKSPDGAITVSMEGHYAGVGDFAASRILVKRAGTTAR